MFLPWSIFGRSHKQGKDNARAAKAKKSRKAAMQVEQLEERAVPATYFVDATNANPGTGTAADPFRTIQAAIKQANSTMADDLIFVFGNNSTNPQHVYVWRRDGDANGDGVLDGDMVLTSQNAASGRVEVRFVNQTLLEGGGGLPASLIVKMENNIVDVGTNATLRIGDNGDASHRVIFTSYFDDSAGGDTNADGDTNAPQRRDWGGIRFRAGAVDQGATQNTGSIVNWADIRYTGATLPDVVAGAPTEFGSIRMEATVNGNNVTASSQVRVWNTIFRHGGRAIDVNVNSLGGTANPRGPDIGYNAGNVGGLGIQQNSYDDNTINGIFVFIPEDPNTGVVQQLLVDAILDDVGNPYVFTQRLILGTRSQTPGGGTEGAITLTVDPGVVLKFQRTSLDGMDIQDPDDRVFSTIEMNGTADMPILVTALTDDNIGFAGSTLSQFYQNGTQDTNNDGNLTTPQPGDWGGIRIGQGNIDHAVIRYGGGLVPINGIFVNHPAITIFSRDLSPAPIGGDVQFVRVANSDISRTFTGDDSGTFYDSPAIDMFHRNYGDNRVGGPITATGIVQVMDNFIHNNQGKAIQAHPLYFNGRINPLGGYGVYFRRNIIENNGHSNGVYINFTAARNLSPESGYFDDTDINHIFDGEALITNPDQTIQFQSRRGVLPSILNGYLDRFTDESSFRTALQQRLPGINPIQLERGPGGNNNSLIDSGLYYNFMDFTVDARGTLLPGASQSSPGTIRPEAWRDWGVDLVVPGSNSYFPFITRGYNLAGDADPTAPFGGTPFLATTDPGGNGSMDLNFPNAISAFGFYIVDNEATSPNERIELYGTDGTLLETIAMPVGDRQFIGRISRQPIAKIRIFEDADDNVGSSFTGASVAIPDNGTNADSVINVASSFTISDVDVIVNVTHPRVSDLELTLIGPGGQQVQLASRLGGAGAAGANLTGTYFDQAGAVSITSGFAPYTGVFRPVGDLSVFNGTNAQGNWTLRVRDLQTGSVGTLNNWTLKFKSPTLVRDAIGIDDLYFVEAGESLVVKAFSQNTQITAAGATDGNGNYFNDGFSVTISNPGAANARASGMGGGIRVLGQGRYPVFFTGIRDDTIGAGIVGRQQFDAGADGNTQANPGQWRGIVIAQGANSSLSDIVTQDASGTLVKRYADLNPYTLGDEGPTYLPGFDSYKDIYYQGLGGLRRAVLDYNNPNPIPPVFRAYTQDGTLIEHAAVRYATVGIDQRGYPEEKLQIESNEIEAEPQTPRDVDPFGAGVLPGGPANINPLGPMRVRADNTPVFDTMSGAWRVGARIGGTSENALTGTDDIDWYEVPELPAGVTGDFMYVNVERGSTAADGAGSNFGVAVFNRAMQLLYIASPGLPASLTDVSATQIANSGGALGDSDVSLGIFVQTGDQPHVITDGIGLNDYDAQYIAVFPFDRIPRSWIDSAASPPGLRGTNDIVDMIPMGPGDGSNGFIVLQHLTIQPGSSPTPVEIPNGDSFYNLNGNDGSFLGGYEVEFRWATAENSFDRLDDPIRAADGQIIIRDNLISNNSSHGITLRDVEVPPGPADNTVFGPTIPNQSARFASPNENAVTNSNGNAYTNPNYFVVGPAVYNNLIINNGGDGIKETESFVLNPVPSTPVPTGNPNPPRPTAFTQIFNNTIDRNGGTGINVFTRGGPNIVNNIISNNNVGLTVIDYGNIGGAQQAVASYNMLFLNGNGTADFGAGTSFNGTQNIVNQSPRYVDEFNGDYRILLASPAVDSSISNIADRLASARFPTEQSRAPVDDYRGGLRIDNPAKPNVGAGQFPFYDRGAFEANEPSLRVVSLSVFRANNVLGEPVTQFAVTFSGRVDPTTVNSNTVFVRRGSTTGPVIPIGLATNTYDPLTDLHTFIIPMQTPLLDDVFCITLRGITDVSNPNGIKNIAGQLLDGEFDGLNFPSGNGQAGGNFNYCFAVRTVTIKGLVWNNPNGNTTQDAGENGLANIRLNVTYAGPDGVFNTTDDQVLPAAVTNGQGRYTQSGLPAGSYRIDVDDSSLPANFFLNTPPDPKFITLGIGETSPDINFGYWLDLSNARIGDTVWNDANGDGIRNAGEAGIPNVIVQATGAGRDATFGTSDDFNLSTITDANGSYSFASLPAGTYRVNVDTSSLLPGFGRTFPATVPYIVTLIPGQVNNNVDFGFQQKNSVISGKIFDDVNFNGTDDGEGGLLGVTVNLVWAGFNNVFGDTDDVTFTTTTAAGGTYSFQNLGSGNYRIAVDDNQPALTNYFRTTPNNPINVTLTSGNQTVSNQLFGYSADPANGQISGTAFQDLNGNGVNDAEPGLNGLLVTLVWAGRDNIFGNGDDTTQTFTTPASGAYSFTGLWVGNYRVSTATPTGGTWANTTPNPITINRTKNQAASTVNFGWIREESTISGTVFQDLNGNGNIDAGDSPFATNSFRVYVDANNNDTFDVGERSTFSAAGTGAYSLTNLRAGTHRIRIDKTTIPTGFGRTPAFRDVTVGTSATVANQNLGLQARNGRVQGTLFNDRNANGVQNSGELGLGGVQVVLVWYGADGVFGTGDDETNVATTNTAGQYSFSGLAGAPSGNNYRISVNSGTLPPGSTPTQPNPAQVDFNLPVNGTVVQNFGFTLPPGSEPGLFYFTVDHAGTLVNSDNTTLAVNDTDIIKLLVGADGSRTYSIYFRGSDVGLTPGTGEAIDAFTFLRDGSIVMSFKGTASFFQNWLTPGHGSGTTVTGIAGEDLMRFIPSQVNGPTAGTWRWFVDGSDVWLSGTQENIDAVSVLYSATGLSAPVTGVLISTTGNALAAGVAGTNADVLKFTPTALGANTTGSYSLYFKGSNVGFDDNTNENIDGLAVNDEPGNPTPTMYFSTAGNFTVPGAQGTREDILQFNPTQLGANTAGTFNSQLILDGSARGLSAFDLNDFYVGPAPGDPLAGGTPTGFAPSSLRSASNLGLNGSDLQSLATTESSSFSYRTTKAASSLNNTASLAHNSVNVRKAAETFFLKAKKAGGAKTTPSDAATVASALASSLVGLS
jgi:subtilisin-like proprotein convertase family protein